MRIQQYFCCFFLCDSKLSLKSFGTSEKLAAEEKHAFAFNAGDLSKHFVSIFSWMGRENISQAVKVILHFMEI